ncbi:MAG: hypothetical protein NZM12_05100, partial [Steroidobacteraceae bacterium]|nr:hypothetical protein [Steroidobacteraceae bacterium]
MLGTIPVPALGDFPYPVELHRDVQFWVRVFTEITTEQGFLHDERHLGVIYATVKLPATVDPRERQNTIDTERDRYAEMLRNLANRWQTALTTEPSPEHTSRAIGEIAPPSRPVWPAVLPLTDEERRVLDMWGSEATA